ncbi:MAG: 1-acyl-sn-glycerol-3-phosphate acyltransferase, partial [Balneolaceae bacterium]
KSWPLVGFLTKTVGVIFIDRSLRSDVKRVNLKISGHLTQSQGIVLFPEGKTSDGSAVLPFRPSLLEHPVRTGLPVHYAVIRYETVQWDIPANESVCWWENVFFPTHIYKLAMLRKIICTVRFGDCEYRSADRKDLARHLWQEVSDRFAPMTDGG